MTTEIAVRSEAIEISGATCPRSRTVPGLLSEMAERHGDRPVIVAGEVHWTYGELKAQVDAFAKGLLALGLGRGSRVAVLMGNRPEWIVADLAICSIGAVMIAVNTWLTPRELHYVLDHSDAEALCFSRHFLRTDFGAALDQIRDTPGSLRKLKHYIHVGEPGYRDATAYEAVIALGASISEERLRAAETAVSPADVAYLLYTSGSTSAPKGVQLLHEGLIANMWEIGERMHVSPSDRLWLAVSLFWGFGCENALFNVLTHGAALVLQEHFEAGEALRLIEAERCTMIYATPNMVKMLHEHPDREQRDLRALRSGGALGTPDQIQQAIDLGAHEICNIYGLTEIYGNCHVFDCRLDPPDRRHVSVGRPLPTFVQRIVDPETLAPLPPGETGEIQLKGCVTPGYYKDEEKTRAAFTEDGYFRTGDLGFVDAEGFLYFRGRLKEMIKSGGINVSPAEIEEVLSSHADIEAAYVVGLPDLEKDEVIGAVLVGRLVADSELRTFCRSRLAAYKVPRRFVFVEAGALPMTTTGKVQRNRLQELFGAAGA
jgi:fatty-acyl-CoA synthase